MASLKELLQLSGVDPDEFLHGYRQESANEQIETNLRLQDDEALEEALLCSVIDTSKEDLKYYHGKNDNALDDPLDDALDELAHVPVVPRSKSSVAKNTKDDTYSSDNNNNIKFATNYPDEQNKSTKITRRAVGLP